ncbi:unnamed protein product [Agarophyton chilense]
MGNVQSEDPEVKKNELYVWNWETVPPNLARPQVNAITPEEKELLPISMEKLLQAQVEDESCKETAQFVRTPGSLVDYERFGLLCRRSPLDGALQRVIPTSLRAPFLYLAHFPRLGGHPGGRRVYQTLRKFFYWPLMAQDLWQTARNRASCAQIRGSRASHQAKLKLFPAAGMKNVTTTAYHPQSNDQAQRFNRTLLDPLAHYVSEHQLDWDEYVEPLVYAYNTQVHAFTGTTPFDLTLTRAPPPIAFDLPESIIPQDITEGMTATQAKRYSSRRIDRILQSVKTVLTKAQRRYKCNFDKADWKTPTFEKVDLFYLDWPPKDSEELEDTTWKLLPRSTGPYKVLKANEHTIILLIDGLQDTVSIYRVTRAPSSSRPRKSQPPDPGEAPRPQVDTQVSTSPKAVPADWTSPTDPMVNAKYHDPSLPTDSDRFALMDHTLLPEDEYQQEYLIERIISAGTGEDGTLRYRVRWFCYTPEEDTWQETQTIPVSFIAHYWRIISYSERGPQEGATNWRRISHSERGLQEGATICPNNPTISPKYPKKSPEPPPDTMVRRSTTVRRSSRIREQIQPFGDT